MTIKQNKNKYIYIYVSGEFGMYKWSMIINQVQLNQEVHI